MSIAWRSKAAFAVALGLALVGCISLGDDEPDESTAGPDDNDAAQDDARNGSGDGARGADDDDDDDATGSGQGQGQEQGQGQGQHVTVNQNQTVIVQVGPTPTTVAATPPRSSPTPVPASDDADDDAEGPRVWPSAGSRVVYRVAWHDVDDGRTTRTDARAEWTHDGRDWTGTCTQTERELASDGSTLSEETSSRTFTIRDPPHWPLFNTRSPPAAGADIETWHLHVCEIVSGDHQYAGQSTTTWDGRTLLAHSAVERDAEADEKDFRTEWDVRTGLVLRWDLRESDGDRLVGELAATDAPLAHT